MHDSTFEAAGPDDWAAWARKSAARSSSRKPRAPIRKRSRRLGRVWRKPSHSCPRIMTGPSALDFQDLRLRGIGPLPAVSNGLAHHYDGIRSRRQFARDLERNSRVGLAA